jgi:streptogramin lyase
MRRALRQPRAWQALVVTGIAWLASCGHEPILQPTSAEPACGLSSTTLAFDTVAVGDSAERAFTLTNTGGGTLAGDMISPSVEFIVSPQHYALASGAAGTFTVRFRPVSAGEKSAALSTGSSQCPGVIASGIAGQRSQAGPGCFVSPRLLDFGSARVGETVDRSFTIRNDAGTTLTGTVASMSPEFIVQGSPSYSLGPAATDTVVVRYAPTTSGRKNSLISTGSPLCGSISVSGSTPEPVCSLNPATLGFGGVSVGDSAERSFTISNTGDGTLTGHVSVPSGEFVLESPADYALRFDAAATFTIRFKPTSTGDKSITVSTGSALCGDVTVTGQGQTGIRTGEILVADRTGSGLLRVDPATGAQRTLAAFGGSPLPGGSGVSDVNCTVDGKVFGITTIGAVVFQVDPITQQLTFPGNTGALKYPSAIEVAPGGGIYVVDDGLMDFTRGRALVPGIINAFTISRTGIGYIALADSALPPSYHLYSVNLDTGERSRMRGAGFYDPRGLTVEAAGDLIVTERGRSGGQPSVLRFHPDSGAVEIVSAGGQLMAPWGVALDSDGSIIVADNQRLPGCVPDCSGAVFRVDPTTGAQTLISEKGQFHDITGVDVYRGPSAAVARRIWGTRSGPVYR